MVRTKDKNMNPGAIYNFSDYTESLNEGNSYKKDFGILGPFQKWGYKIKASCPDLGGKSDDSCILISDPNNEDPNLCLKYIYGGKESDPIYLPKSSIDFSGDPKYPSLQTRPNTRWWEEESNQEILDDFIDSYLESKHFEAPGEDSPQEDIESILDLLGIDSPITDFSKKKNFHWEGKLEDGTEVEMRKKDNDDFLKNLKIYFGSDSYSPEVEIYRDSPGFETIFSTPKGKFVRKTKNLSDFLKDPIHQYLFHSSMKKDPSLYQEPVLNYLNSILRSHDWRPGPKKDMDSFLKSQREIDQIKRILSNTISEEEIDEIYSKSRERFSPGSSNKSSEDIS